jgi:CheY-like chemotaxis protein
MSQPPPTVLIVDDSLEFRRILREALSLEGYHVLVAADGQEGVRLFRHAHFAHRDRGDRHRERSDRRIVIGAKRRWA